MNSTSLPGAQGAVVRLESVVKPEWMIFRIFEYQFTDNEGYQLILS